MAIQQKTVKALGWSAAQTWMTRGISFVVFALLARLISPEAFGLVAIAVVFIEIVKVIVNEGFSDAIIQRADLQREHLDTSFWTAVAIGALLSTVSFSAAGLVARLYEQPELEPILRWMSLLFIIEALSKTQRAILVRDLAFKSLTVRSLFAVVAGGIVGVMMALLDYGVWSLVGQQLVSSFAGVVALWTVADWRPSFRFSRRHFKELFQFGISVALTKILTTVTKRSNDLLIGLFLGPVALGYYFFGVRVVSVLSESVFGFAKTVAFPMFSRMKGDSEKLRNGCYRATEIASAVSLPIFAGLITVAPELVSVVFGDKWQPSVLVVQILAIGGMLQSVSFNSVMLLAGGKPSWNLRMMFVHSVCSLVGLLVAIQFGIVAVAVSYVTVRLLLWPCWILIVKRLIQLELREYVRQFAMPFAAAAIMAMAVFAAKRFLYAELNQTALLATSIIFGAITYTVVLRCTSPALFHDAYATVRPLFGRVVQSTPQPADD